MQKPSAAHTDHKLERLVFFSDAVFAIAITLLIIEIKVPHLPDTATDAIAWQVLADNIASFFGFVLSFLVIGRLWIGHHSALGVMAHHDDKLLLPNLGLLMAIAFLPFSTAFMSSNIKHMVPLLFYNVSLLVTALLSARVVWLATVTGNVTKAFEDRERRRLRRRSLSVIMAIGLATALTPLVPGPSELALLTMMLWPRLIARFEKKTA